MQGTQSGAPSVHGHSVSNPSRSNPFEGSDVQDEIQLEDFSYIQAQVPHPRSPVPRDFVKEHLSRPKNNTLVRSTTRQRSASLDDDRAASE